MFFHSDSAFVRGTGSLSFAQAVKVHLTGNIIQGAAHDEHRREEAGKHTHGKRQNEVFGGFTAKQQQGEEQDQNS